MNITYSNYISVEDYNILRASAGWLTVHPEQAEVGLKGSALVIAAKDGDKTVGTARLVSDGRSRKVPCTRQQRKNRTVYKEYILK